MYKNAWSPDGSNVVHLLAVLEAIESGRWKEKVELIRSLKTKKEIDKVKKTLPCVTFSGIYSTRQEENLKEYTNVFVLDFDKIKKKDVLKMKMVLIQDPFVASVFLSPSKGLKVLVEVNSTAQQHREYAFPALEHYFSNNYDLEVDPSGKDPTRLCFVSYDPEVHYNPDYEVFNVDIDHVNHFKSVKNKYDHLSEHFEPSEDLKFIFKTAIKMVKASKTGGYYKGNRNNFIYVLACVLNRAGVDESDAHNLIWQRYDSLDPKEVLATVSSPYKNKKMDHGTNPIMQKKTRQISMFKRGN